MNLFNGPLLRRRSAGFEISEKQLDSSTKIIANWARSLRADSGISTTKELSVQGQFLIRRPHPQRKPHRRTRTSRQIARVLETKRGNPGPGHRVLETERGNPGPGHRVLETKRGKSARILTGDARWSGCRCGIGPLRWAGAGSGHPVGRRGGRDGDRPAPAQRACPTLSGSPSGRGVDRPARPRSWWAGATSRPSWASARLMPVCPSRFPLRLAW